MKTRAFALGTLVTVLLASPAAEARKATYIAEMSGELVRPAAVNSSATADLRITIDTDTKTFCAYANFTPKTFAPTAMHLHLGKSDSVGAVILDLPGQPVSGEVYVAGSISSQLSAQIASDAVYAQVHTALHPSGELRGQLVEDGTSEAAVCPDGDAGTGTADAGADAALPAASSEPPDAGPAIDAGADAGPEFVTYDGCATSSSEAPLRFSAFILGFAGFVAVVRRRRRL